MLVHICCSVDSHFFLEKIKQEYNKEKLIGYFYDPNIHPYSEYRLRFQDVAYSCDLLDILLIEGPYDLEGWFSMVQGFENEPEKGDRCTICFEDRLRKTAQKAIELGHKSFTSSLLVSPQKSQQKLYDIGKKLEKEFGLEFVFVDYRANNGTIAQSESVKKNNLYRQDYCGCIFALSNQRQNQNKIAEELSTPLSRQILPNSIEDRLKKFATRKNTSLLYKTPIINYRLLRAFVAQEKTVIASYFLAYSHLKTKKSQCTIEFVQDGIHYANKHGIQFITLDYFNTLACTNYKTVRELCCAPLLFDQEITLRSVLTKNHFDISPIIVLDSIQNGSKYEVYLESIIYEDTLQVIENRGDKN